MTKKQAQKLVANAKCPEDVFGVFIGLGIATGITKAFRALSVLLHPDKNGGKDLGFARLNEWMQQADEKLRAGTYGDRKPLAAPTVIATRSNAYTVVNRLPEGALCSIYEATDNKGDRVIVKIARNPRDTDLLVAEAQNLMAIHTMADHPSPKLRKQVADCVTSFDVVDAKVRRKANIIRHPGDGWVTLEEILKGYPNGLELGDAAWMFNRVLAGLLCAHEAGIIHGAVFPEHVLLEPENHGGILIDWCYSVKAGQPLKAIVGQWKGFYPVTVLSKKPATPATDVYMAAMLLDRMTGFRGRDLPPVINNLIAACLLPSGHRIQTASELANAFREALERLFGPPKFRKFVWPKIRE